MDKKSALLRQVWKATTSEVFLIHSSNWMESDAWMQGGKAGTNPKLLVVTEKRENGDDRKPRRWLLIAVHDHKLAELPLFQTTDDPTIGNPDEEPAAERNDETAHCDRQ